jgi:phosphoserine phosphatase RsbU/P
MAPLDATLLVVDDIEDNREMLTERLAQLGYRNVTTADSGRMALELIGKQRFDLVLLDVMMPVTSGPQVLEQLRREARLAELPVIMVSALSELDTVVRCIELGAEDYLTKPVNTTLLRARIGATLEKKRLRDAARARLVELDEELAAARALQLGMVPEDLHSPDSPVSVHALLEPARQVSGDLCDFFAGEGDALWFVVGDVSGKGPAAALFMARTWSTFRSIATRRGTAEQGEPGRVLSAVNRALCHANQSSMFATLVAGRLHAASGVVELANAGHPAALLLGGDGRVSAVESVALPPLGAWPDTAYPTGRFQLAPRDGLFVYTDGITEATDPGGAQYSEERLHADLAELGAGPGRELLRALLERVRRFAGATPPADDLTALLLRWRPG